MSANQGHHHVNYFLIFMALVVCTALSIVFDVVEMNRKLLIVLVLAVASAKAMFVLRYFMHLKFEGNWKYVLLMPTTILSIGIPLALLPDVGFHYYTYAGPQIRYTSHATREAAEEHARSEHNGAEPDASQDEAGHPAPDQHPPKGASEAGH